VSEIDFETGGPVFQIEIYHRNPGTTGHWVRVFNAPDERAAISRAVHMFEMEGFNPVIIDQIIPSELVKPEGGDENGS
jgi:hypothetical protein